MNVDVGDDVSKHITKNYENGQKQYSRENIDNEHNAAGGINTTVIDKNNLTTASDTSSSKQLGVYTQAVKGRHALF